MSLVGRGVELERLAISLEASSTASMCVLIEGERGAGATALLAAAASAAENDGVRVLRCRPLASEVHLDYAAIADLLAPINDLAMILPTPRRALETALLRNTAQASSSGHTRVPDERAVGTGCVQLVHHLAALSPLLLVIDGADWLDDASAAALRYMLRRLPFLGVTTWIAHRRSTEPLAEGDVLVLGPLSERASEAVVRGAWTTMPNAPVMRRIVAAAGGNPLIASELARALGQRGLSSHGLLPLPAVLTQWVDAVFGTLPAAAVDVLAILWCAPHADVDVFVKTGLDESLDECERRGLIATSARMVYPVHSLLPLVAAHRSTPMKVRSIHDQLANVCNEPDERARHRALSIVGSDDALATELAEYAEAAAATGKLERAAELASLSLALTSQTHVSHSARVAFDAHLLFQQGDSDGALQRLDALDPTRAPSTALAAASLVRAKVAFSSSTIAEAVAHAEDALRLCTTDAERVEAYSILSRVSYNHFPTAAQHARTALRLAEHTDVSTNVLSSALVGYASATFMAGEGLDRECYQQAMEIERTSPVYAADSAFASFAAMLKIADEIDESRGMLCELLARNRDDGALPFALSHLPQLELWAGNWDAAEDYAHRHLAAASTAGQHDQVAQANFNLAMVNAYRGAVDDAVTIAGNLHRSGLEHGEAWTERNGLAMLGLVALSTGDAETAVGTLSQWHELTLRMGLHEPGYCRMRSDFVEALVATGRLSDADEIVDIMQSDADRFQRTTLVAAASRAAALVAASRGERVEALFLAGTAVDRYATTTLALEHARALLTLGQLHRRFKEKAAARTHLRAALEAFERLGAERFAARARQDLARIGLRPPASTGLTETERRVAELAATGRTVRQVGDDLFISHKTVEANLTRVYRKLGIGGRAELATWLAAQG